MGNKPLEIFLGVLVGAVGVIVLLYAIGWVRNWKLPGLATLKQHFSSSSNATTSSSSSTVTAAAKNFYSNSYPSVDFDEDGNSYCPEGWVVNNSGPDNFERYGCFDIQSKNSASFNSTWDTTTKQIWAEQHRVSWPRPSPRPPPYNSKFQNIDSDSRTFCPDGWVVNDYTNGSSYICRNYYDGNSFCGNLQSTAKFTAWDTAETKKTWATHCNAKWPNPSPNVPQDDSHFLTYGDPQTENHF